MVTGTVPEPASERIVDDKLEPPRALNPEVPPGLSTVIEEAMAVQGEDRPPTAAALQERLRAVTYETEDEQRSTAQEPSRPPTSASSRQTDASPPSSAPRWTTTLLGVLVVALLGLGGWADYQYGLIGLLPAEPSSPPPSIAEAGDEAGPSEDNLELPDDNSGERPPPADEPPGAGQQYGGRASAPGSENNQSGPDGNESSSQRQAGGSDSQEQTDDSGPVDLEQNAAGPAGEGRADETPEREEDAPAGDRGQSGKNASDMGDEQDAGDSTKGSATESEEQGRPYMPIEDQVPLRPSPVTSNLG